MVLEISFVKRQFDKMIKHTQAIRRLWTINCLSVFEHFEGLTFKELVEGL